MLNNFVQQAYRNAGLFPPRPFLHRLVASNLPYDVTETELERLFNGYGCCRLTVRRYFSIRWSNNRNEVLECASAMLFFPQPEQGEPRPRDP